MSEAVEVGASGRQRSLERVHGGDDLAILIRGQQADNHSDPLL